MIQTALQAKANKALDMKIRYSEGVMTRREFITKLFTEGGRVEKTTKPRIEYNRTKFNRMDNNQQAEYEKLLAEPIDDYRAYRKGETCYVEITKTEFDYFHELSEYEEDTSILDRLATPGGTFIN